MALITGPFITFINTKLNLKAIPVPPLTGKGNRTV